MPKNYTELALEELKRDYERCGIEKVCGDFKTFDAFVEMRDGKKMKTVVYLPDMEGVRFPVILQRSCYPRDEVLCRAHGERLALLGYAYVCQYCRGTGGSEGEWEPNVNERNDGIDTVKWLKSQPWTDVIGFWGSSYLALTGWAMADAVGDMVASMCLTQYGTDRFKSAYEKGMFRQDVLTAWSMGNTGFPVAADYYETCRYMPQAEVDTALWGQEVPWYREYVTNPKRTDKYWQSGFWKQLEEIPSKVEIPLYIMEGWYDHHFGSAMNSWKALSEKSKSMSRLDVGAWNHGFQMCIPGKKIENAENSSTLKALEWFEQTLKRKETPKPMVRMYIIGEDRWETFDFWEGRDTAVKELYLDAGSRTVSEKAPEQEGAVSYTYSPDNPVESHGSESLLRSGSKNGSLLQPGPDHRPDVISFMSGILREPLKISGGISVRLRVSSDCEDTAFTAKIMEVTPSGEVYNIRSSITTISQGADGGEKYIPGEAASVLIDMWDICYTLPEGSRMRIDISSSDFPNFHIHSNYRGIWGLQKEKRNARQTILTGGTASKITIQVSG